MRQKILALAIASALAVPQTALAARDGDGMEYVSASEGFYGSLRMMFSNQHNKSDATADQNGIITGDGSRLGIRGTHDLGHGLTGVYRYEFAVPSNNGDSGLKTRLHYVGLKGAFGEVQGGAIWGNGYNWVTSATDIATTGSGNFAPRFRSNNSIQYTSPNLNGFQGSFRVAMNGGGKTATTPMMEAALPKAVKTLTSGTCRLSMACAALPLRVSTKPIRARLPKNGRWPIRCWRDYQNERN